MEILESMATPMNLDDRQSLLTSANTSLGSKVVSQHSTLLGPLAVDAVLKVIDPAKDRDVDLRVRVFSVQICDHSNLERIYMVRPGYQSHSEAWWNHRRHRAR